MKTSRIYCIGPIIHKNRLTFSGQAMMFQLFVDKLKIENYEVKVIDISDNDNKRVSGAFSILRSIHYIFLTIKFFINNLNLKKSIVYITVSQSKVGFFRDFIFINIAKLYNHKIICHQFGGNFRNFYNSQNKLFKKLIESTYLKVNSIIVEGDYSKNNFEFLQNDYLNIIIIPNGLPEKIKIDYEQKIYKQNTPFRILYLSNMIFSKGYMDVLDSMNLLINKYNLNVECNFVGKFIPSIDDPIGKDIKLLENEFKNKILSLGLTKYVNLHNSMYGDEKIQIFQISNVFILPSFYINEGQPVSVLEAIAYGLVPILTNYRLMPQMLNSNSGFLINKNSPDKIAEIIANLIQNPTEYSQFSKNSILHFNLNFSSEMYLKKLIKLINSYE